MLEDDGTATTTQEENYEFKKNSAMTDDSITADNLEEMKMELLQLKLSKLQDSATGNN
jgi:hypothetical protein